MRHTLAQRFTFEKFKDQESDTVEFLKIVDRGNVRVVQRGENFRFALEAAHAVRIARKLVRQDLDRHTRALVSWRERGRPLPCRLYRAAT